MLPLLVTLHYQVSFRDLSCFHWRIWRPVFHNLNGVAEELGSGLLAFFSILARPTMKSGLLQEHVLEFQNVQTTLDQCQPQYCWHFVPDDWFFVVWSCPIHYRFDSIPGLCSRDASSTPSLSCHNPKWLQTLPNVPGDTKVENLCPRSYRWQIPYLRFSFSFHFPPR